MRDSYTGSHRFRTRSEDLLGSPTEIVDLGRPKVLKVTPVDEGHQVVTVESTTGLYRRSPCPGCPWRVDQTGVFPADAFRASANTAYDMSGHMFGCHESGVSAMSTCAGFLLRGADHNMAVRKRVALTRTIDLTTVHDGGHELHEDYRAMAIANGVPADDEALKECR